jgi:hypothetical protein
MPGEDGCGTRHPRNRRPRTHRCPLFVWRRRSGLKIVWWKCILPAGRGCAVPRRAWRTWSGCSGTSMAGAVHAEFSRPDGDLPLRWRGRHAQELRWPAGPDRAGGHGPCRADALVFRNRRSDRLKILYFDRDGLAIWYKRLEQGRFQWPRVAPGQSSVSIEAGALQLILEGIDLDSVRRRKRYRPPGTPGPGPHVTWKTSPEPG